MIDSLWPSKLLQWCNDVFSKVKIFLNFHTILDNTIVYYIYHNMYKIYMITFQINPVILTWKIPVFSKLFT